MIGHANKKNTQQRREHPQLNVLGQVSYPQVRNSISRAINERHETGQGIFHPSMQSFGLLRGMSDVSKKDFPFFFNKPLSRMGSSVGPLGNFMDSSFREQEYSFMKSKVGTDSQEELFTPAHSYRPGGSIFSIKHDSQKQVPFFTQEVNMGGPGYPTELNFSGLCAYV